MGRGRGEGRGGGGGGEETKTIDTTRRQGQSGRVLFAARPIKMPTTSPAGPLIRRHVNQSWNSTLINTGFRWSCLATYLSNDTNVIWSDTCTSVKYLSDWRMSGRSLARSLACSFARALVTENRPRAETKRSNHSN